MKRFLAALRARFAPVPAPPMAYAVVLDARPNGMLTLYSASMLDEAQRMYIYWRKVYLSCGWSLLYADSFGAWLENPQGNLFALCIRPIALADEPLPPSELIPLPKLRHIVYTLPAPRLRSVN